MDTDNAELIKNLALTGVSRFNWVVNPMLCAVSLYYFVTTFKHKSVGKENQVIDLIEYPIYYGFKIIDILSYQDKFEKIYTGVEFTQFNKFQTSLTYLVSPANTFIHSDINLKETSLREEMIVSTYFNYFDKIENHLHERILFGEMLIGNQSLFLNKMQFIFESYSSRDTPIFTNIVLLDDLRSLILNGCALLYKNFMWGNSFLFTILASSCYVTKRYMLGLSYLQKAYFYVRNRRDYIQLLYLYTLLLRSIKKINYVHNVLGSAYDTLFKEFQSSENFEMLDFVEYSLIVYYILPTRLALNGDGEVVLMRLIKYLIFQSRWNTESLTLPPSEILEIGLQILDQYDFELGYENSLVLIGSGSLEIFYLLYRMELYNEHPDLEKIIQISEFILLMTTDLNTFSRIYNIPYNYVNERLIHYVNLFVFYSFTNNYSKYNLLRHKFEIEFESYMENELFSSIKFAIST